MKRSEALTPLSHDHHQALVVAQRLRRADAGDAAGARAGFLTFWAEHGQRHFRQEEELLLPAYAAHGDARHPLVLQALGEHVELRRRAAELAAAPLADPVALCDLGELLLVHVRMEERELFPMIEAALPAPAQADLARALAGPDAAG